MTTAENYAPLATRQEKALEKHNHLRVDPYFWLNQRENPEVINYLKEENNYLDNQLASVKNLRSDLFEEMKSRIKEDDESLPYFKDGYWFYSRFEKGKEYPIHCRKTESLDAEEEILLDVNELAKGQSYCQVSSLSLHKASNQIIFGMDTSGRRQYSLHLKDLASGSITDLKISNTTGYAPWSAKGDYFFYTEKDETTLRASKIYRRQLGEDKSTLIFEEKDETFNASIYKSKSRDYLIIGCGSTLSNEFHFLSAKNPTGQFRVFHPREKKLEYGIAHYNDKFYILTNWEAENFRLMECPIDQTEKAHWNEVIAHRPDVLLEGIEIFNNHLVLEERFQGLTQLHVIRQSDQEEHLIELKEEAYTLYSSTNPEFNTATFRFGYTSLTTPNSVYDYQLDSREMKLMKQQEVLGDFDPLNYQSKRLWATAADGTEIPISLVYSRQLYPKTPKEAPLLLYGYGSYGASMDPYFSSTRLSLLDRGFVFAIAHIRGGEEMGRKWYEGGKMEQKQNTFSDFISCAEHLIKTGYTNNSKLCAMGGSAGGLLMGAVINQRPELWKAVIAAVPFVDVVTTMLDDTIPLTTGEYDEWGNPNNEKDYHTMLAYSPYDNVKNQDYPNLLVTTGLHDSQVQYWEPAKWVAKLRHEKTDNNLLLLQTNMDAGHGGSSGRFEPLKEIALNYAFLLFVLGLDQLEQ